MVFFWITTGDSMMGLRQYEHVTSLISPTPPCVDYQGQCQDTEEDEEEVNSVVLLLAHLEALSFCDPRGLPACFVVGLETGS